MWVKESLCSKWNKITKIRHSTGACPCRTRAPVIPLTTMQPRLGTAWSHGEPGI